MTRQSLTVVVPVLNEEASLPALVARLEPVLEACGLAWQVIFVDDGSADGTLAALAALNARDGRYRAVALSRNFGKERAIAAGLAYAGAADAVVLIDADLQHPPEVIAGLLARWREGYQVVYGVRQDRATDGPLRRTLARLYYRLFRALSHTELPAGAGDFRLLDRKAVAAMNRLGERARFNKGLYSWIGFRSVGVPFQVEHRRHGAAKWSPRRLLHFALDGFMSFSTVPLRASSILGVIISALAIAYAVYFLVKTLLLGVDVPGFPTLVISVMFFSGVQLISLGVLGEYLGRVYDEVKARPLYLVAEEIGLAGEEEKGATAAGRTGGHP